MTQYEENRKQKEILLKCAEEYVEQYSILDTPTKSELKITKIQPTYNAFDYLMTTARNRQIFIGKQNEIRKNIIENNRKKTILSTSKY